MQPSGRCDEGLVEDIPDRSQHTSAYVSIRQHTSAYVSTELVEDIPANEEHHNKVSRGLVGSIEV